MPQTKHKPSSGQLELLTCFPSLDGHSAHVAIKPPCVAGSDTSAEAAISIAPKTTNLRVCILAFIRNRKQGATADEIEVALNLRHQTASARCRELSILNQIERRLDPKTGKTIRRKTRSGRYAEVLFAVP